MTEREREVTGRGRVRPKFLGSCSFSRSEKQRNRENDRMGKTSDLDKKIGDAKGIFHAKMGTIKDRNGKGLTEAEEMERIYRRTIKWS